MKRKKVKRDHAGQPEKYQKEYADLAYKFCLLGADDAQLAEMFAVQESTINNWKLRHPEFLESIKKGKNIADANVADSLYRKALGYSHDAVKIFNDEGSPMEVPYVEHYPPDTTAAIFWLKNRQKKNWRDKQDVEHTVSDMQQFLSKLDGTANKLNEKPQAKKQ